MRANNSAEVSTAKGKVKNNIMMSILSIIADILYIVVLNIPLYTDRAVMPGGDARVWRLSPLQRLQGGDLSFLFYLELLCIAVSIAAAVLMRIKTGSAVLKKVWAVSSVISLLLFVTIMIITANIHLKY